MQDHRQLEIWQRAMRYTVALYEFTAQLPADERHNLAGQVRKASVSVALNIAEGAGCASSNEFRRFLGCAYRSLKEIETCLELCQMLFPTLPLPPVAPLLDEADQLSRMIRTLMQRLAHITHNS